MKNYEILLCEEYLASSYYQRGDLNKDGKLDWDDYDILYEYWRILPRPEVSDEMKTLLDIDGDGDFDDWDQRHFKSYLEGDEEKTPGYSEIIRDQELRVRFIAEIGSSTSTFSGKAIDPIFYTKIDGTHELTFELPKYYFDESTGEKVFNELTDLLVNKCKILLRFPDEGEDYYLVINERADEEKDGQFKYTYSCNDAFIEELSKTGYGLVFDDDVEGNGLADIHQLAEEILKDTGWSYDREQTGFMGEYRTEVNYNTTQERYDTVQIPHPVHPIKYIPELERYCYVVDSNYKPTDDIDTIYCYEDTEQVTSNTVQNILYNTRDFVSDDGWLKGSNTTSFMPHREVEGEGENATAKYYLHIPKNSNESVLINATAVDSNKTIKANKPYLFHVEYDSILENNIDRGISAGITHIEIYDQNPVLENGEEPPSPKYSLGFEGNLIGSWENSSGTKYGRYIVIKTQESIKNPYISLKVNSSNEPVNIESIQLFELKTMSVEDGISDEETYYDMLRKTPNGTKIDIGEDCTPWIYYDGASSHEEYKVCFPADVISAQTIRRTLFFYLEEGTNTPIYINFNDLKNTPTVSEVEELPVIGEDSIVLDTIRGLNLTYYGLDKVEVSKEVYKLKGVDKYYQYYQLTKDRQVGGAWDLALLGNGLADKRRTLIAEKSNRFNLLQELAELFKTWCIFETKIGENNELQKRVYFRENVINSNFSGFHAGVNLKSLERKVESDEIVTKMYVEDVESDFANDGFVTIRTSSLNPWGENYYYNFKYYGEQKLLSKEDVEKLEFDKEQLYSAVKGKNVEIYELNDKIINAKLEIKNLTYQIESLNYGIAAAMERIASIDADIANYEISQPDKEQLEKNKLDNENRRSEYETELIRATEARKKIEEEYNDWVSQVEGLQGQKEILIKNFENTYAQFIKEGVWSDSTYSDNDTYFLDSQKVSLTSAMPKMSWNISAIDGSVLQELEGFKVKVGDQTILIDNEFFPSKEAKEHVFEVLISGIKEHLDDGTKNEIEIRNYLTRFEDLFQRISAATQTLELNEQTYNRAANFTADGHIDQSLLERSLLENASILANSSDNSYKLDQTGLHLQSLINPVKKLRIVADGIVLSDSLDKNGKEKWTTGISADGINADKITTGSLDTSLIRIYSGGQPSFVWNGLGISAYQDNSHILKVAAIGDSYAAGWNALAVGEKVDKEYGWINYLKENNLYVIGKGTGASGFNPYFHLSETTSDIDNEYCFINQVKNCLYNVAEDDLPSVIIIAGGFNDRNMDITGKIFENGSSENLNLIFSKDLVSEDTETKEKVPTLVEQYWRYIGKPDSEGLTKEDPTPIADRKYMLHAKVTTTGSYTYNGVTYKWFPYNDGSGNEYKESATMDKLKEKISDVNEYIKTIYGSEHLPKIILLSTGRYRNLSNDYSTIINDYMYKDCVYNAYKDAIASFENWVYYDISGLCGNSDYDWVKTAIINEENEDYYNNPAISPATKEQKVYQSDNIHPTKNSAKIISNIIIDILKRERLYVDTTVPVIDGKSFVRLDKYGLYSINNKIGFNYTSDGTASYPWFSGLSKKDAIKEIRDKSTFSLTDAGMSLNIPGSNGSIYLGHEEIGGEKYGLYINDKNGKAVVRLTNNANDCQISGWKMTPTSLRSSLSISGDTENKLITYLCNTEYNDAAAFALGKIRTDQGPKDAPFLVTGDGSLKATKANIIGEITARSGSIGPFTVKTNENKTSGDDVKGAYIFGDYYDHNESSGWAKSLKTSIKNTGVFAESFSEKLVGFGNGSNKRDIPHFDTSAACASVLWKRDLGGGKVTYWTAYSAENPKAGKWKQTTIEEFLKDRSTCLYDAQQGIMYYLSEGNVKTHNFATNDNNHYPDALFLGKTITTMCTSYLTKAEPTLYTNGKEYFQRKYVESEGVVSYEVYNNLQDVPFNQEKMYFLPSAGKFIVYRDNKWVYIGNKQLWGYTTNPDEKKKEIVTIKIVERPSELNNFSGDELLKKAKELFNNNPPYETCIWYEKIGEYTGCWFYDLTSKEWRWGSVAHALKYAAHPKKQYIPPTDLDNEDFPYHFSFDVQWKTVLNSVESLRADAVQLSYDPDKIFQKYALKGGHHIGSGKIIHYSQKMTDYPANPIPLYSHTKLRKDYNDFINEAYKEEDNYTDYYFYKTAPVDLLSTESSYFFWNGSKWQGAVINIDGLYPHIKDFSSFIPSAEEWKDSVSHVYVGGAWYDRTYINENDNSVLQGKKLIEKGIENFCKTINERVPDGKTVNIIIAYLPHSTINGPLNTMFENVAKLYLDTINNLKTNKIGPGKDYSKITLEFKDLTSGEKPWYSEDGTIVKATGKPTSSGVATIRKLLYTPVSTYYTGLVYGRTKDNSGKYWSAGISLKKTSASSVALWAGYSHPSNSYDNPVDDPKRDDNTKFYVTYDGTIHAPELQIGEGSSLGGWTIDSASIGNTYKDDKGNTKYRFFLHGGPNAGDGDGTNENENWLYASAMVNGKKNVVAIKKNGAIYASEGQFTDRVKIGGQDLTASELGTIINNATGGKYSAGQITCINAKKGYIGNWKIDGSSLIGEGTFEVTGDIGARPEKGSVLWTGKGGISLVPSLMLGNVDKDEFSYHGPAIKIKSLRNLNPGFASCSSFIFQLGFTLYWAVETDVGYSIVPIITYGT